MTHTDAEMDKIIAERVMGWVQDTYDTADKYWFRPAERAISLICMGLVCEWFPTRNASQAVEALEALRKQGWGGSISMVDEEQWLCALYNYRLPQHMSGKVGKAGTFARAVCLAICEAVQNAA
jgi:hypothetical protein